MPVFRKICSIESSKQKQRRTFVINTDVLAHFCATNDAFVGSSAAWVVFPGAFWWGKTNFIMVLRRSAKHAGALAALATQLAAKPAVQLASQPAEELAAALPEKPRNRCRRSRLPSCLHTQQIAAGKIVDREVFLGA
jgi:hypothetical protein